MFNFKEGMSIALKSGNPTLGLAESEPGEIWALYDTQPPAYEVTFCPQGGEEFGALMYEEEAVEFSLRQRDNADLAASQKSDLAAVG